MMPKRNPALRKYSASVALLAAVCVLSYAAPSTASVFTLTAVKCTGGTFVQLCYENASKEKLELTGDQAVFFVSGPGDFIIPGLLTILFKEDFGIGEILQPTPLTTAGIFDINFIAFLLSTIDLEPEIQENCKLTTAEEAEVKTKELTGKLTSESSLEVKPATGTEFVSLTLENVAGKTCPALVAGTHSVTGFQNITILEPGVAQAVKKGDAEGKNLKFVGKAAELGGEEELRFETKEGTEKLGDSVYISKEA